MTKTLHLSPDDDGITRATKVLHADRLVAFPTETVYGLGGDARSDMAVARIFEAKGRPRFNPLIVHVADAEQARDFVVWSDLADRLAGPELGLESTIVGLLDTPVLLRPGGLPAEAIEAALGAPLLRRSAEAALTAPGQMASHYAPGVRVRLEATHVMPGEVLLGFGPMACDLNLSRAGDLTEAAANLFGHLHTLDARAPAGIAVAPIPTTGLGAAINDRLARAAAPRDT